ncbi:MAG: tyrosine-type recombinase/integrase [Acidobacteriaceae bacterium]|nr:tyrosine-type recombinase/integrase [Acidobacteriaceae bacterium]
MPASDLALLEPGVSVPAVIADAGAKASYRFLEFFTANIRNPNTRAAYVRALAPFLAWCEKHGRGLASIDPITVAAYVEQLQTGYSKPTVKQHLAAIRMLFDWMVTGGVLPFNPAASVRGPKYVIKKGKTPVLKPDEARTLLDSIDVSDLSGLRDRALLAVMVYSFARVSAVVGMNVEDYYQQGKRWWIRLHEKGGKHHEVPAHHKAEEYLDAYIAAAGIGNDGRTPLWRSMTKERGYGENRMTRIDVFRMIKRRCRQAELGAKANCHTFRATGITAYLLNGGTIENAQAIAAHESPRTTKLYDRTSDEITLDEVERIGI